MSPVTPPRTKPRLLAWPDVHLAEPVNAQADLHAKPGNYGFKPNDSKPLVQQDGLPQAQAKQVPPTDKVISAIRSRISIANDLNCKWDGQRAGPVQVRIRTGGTAQHPEEIVVDLPAVTKRRLALEARKLHVEPANILSIAQEAAAPQVALARFMGFNAPRPLAQIPASLAVLDVLSEVVHELMIPLKARTEVPRPHTLSTKVIPVIPVPEYSSYPAGHMCAMACIVEVFLHVLQLPPGSEAAMRLVSEGKRIGKNRELAGLHTPGHTKAGSTLGLSLAGAFLDSKFRKSVKLWDHLLAQARDEWTHKKPPEGTSTAKRRIAKSAASV